MTCPSSLCIANSFSKLLLNTMKGDRGFFSQNILPSFWTSHEENLNGGQRLPCASDILSL